MLEAKKEKEKEIINCDENKIPSEIASGTPFSLRILRNKFYLTEIDIHGLCAQNCFSYVMNYHWTQM